MPNFKPYLNKWKKDLAYKDRIKRRLWWETEEQIKAKKELWPVNGQINRFKEIYKNIYKNEPIKFLLSLKKRDPKIMILGAGEGSDIKLLRDELLEKKLKPIIDVFSIKKTLEKDVKQNIVRKDFSKSIPFEHIDPRIKEHNEIIKATKGQYDLVMAPFSVGVYTNSISTILLNSAMLLAKNGRAYIQVKLDFLDPIQLPENKMGFELKQEHKLMFNRFVNTINKKENVDYKYKLSFHHNGSILIERVN
jgi:hypothetical protein